MCLILQKLNRCLNSSNVSTDEVGFWCLSELYAIKIVLATLFIHHNISPALCDDRRRVQKNQPKEGYKGNVMWKTMLWSSFCIDRGVEHRIYGDVTIVWPGVLKHAFHFYVIWRRLYKRTSFALYFLLSLLQYFSLVKICLKRETELLSLLGIIMMSTWDSSRKWG